MIKKVLILIAFLLVASYLVMAMVRLNKMPQDAVCREVEFNIRNNANSQQDGFITITELKRLLRQEGLYPQGKRLEDVQCRKIEDYLMKNPYIDEVECFKTPADNVCVEVSQRIPMLYIMGDNGDRYYLDTKGKIMPHAGYVAHLAVVTGAVTRKNASALLKGLGTVMQQDSFWNDQIEQVHVTPTKELELVPRVGDHVVFLGGANDMEEKLGKLKEFYQKALSKAGWNKYSRINIEFNNQIICTKKEK